MHKSPPPINPSQAVERIREIIVGRHLERLEQRIHHLEASVSSQEHADVSTFEDRLLAGEARLEALQDQISRISDLSKAETERRSQFQQEEIQRLAAQIQQIAAARQPANPPEVSHLENKLGHWLSDWQIALNRHLETRDQKLSEQFLREIQANQAAVDARFQKIAEAAQTLIECFTPQKPNPSATPL